MQQTDDWVTMKVPAHLDETEQVSLLIKVCYFCFVNTGRMDTQIAESSFISIRSTQQIRMRCFKMHDCV